MVEIKTNPIHPESGACPKCGCAAFFRLVRFASRTFEVKCSAECGAFQMPKAEIDDCLRLFTSENFPVQITLGK